MKAIEGLEKILRPFRIFLLGGFFLGVFIDLINAAENSDVRLFTLLLLWFLNLRLFRLKSDATVKLALGFLGLLFLFFIFARNSITGERIAVWIYFMMITAVVQQFFELRKESKASA